MLEEIRWWVCTRYVVVGGEVEKLVKSNNNGRQIQCQESPNLRLSHFHLTSEGMVIGTLATPISFSGRHALLHQYRRLYSR